MFNPFKYMGRRKKEVEEVKESSPEVEVTVSDSSSERDADFYKKHTGAREDVIYG